MKETNTNTELAPVQVGGHLHFSKAVSASTGYYGQYTAIEVPFTCEASETVESLVAKITPVLREKYPAKCYSGGKVTCADGIKVVKTSDTAGTVSFFTKWVEA
jgi:hypothetical protein